ncbi:MAG TPA: hypothetical protein VFH66_13835 [Mycobacteriales bacterium]|nr:hypothetical protein [Mycobacteriales bacterium]
MRAVRTFVPVAVAAVVIATPGIAEATTVVSAINMPAGIVFGSGDCAALNPLASGAPDYVHVKGPGTPPLGTGSLRVTFTRVSAADLYKDLNTAGKTVADVTAASFSSYTPAGSTAGAWMYVVADDGTTTTLAYVQAPMTATWTTTDLLTAPSIDWASYSDSTGNLVSTGTGTWTDFTATFGTVHLFEEDVWMDTCSSGAMAGVVYIDNMTMGTAGATTINFEASPATALTISASKNVVVYGSTVTLRTKLTRSTGAALGGKHVLLMARKSGASTFTKVADVVTSSTGVATSKQTPKRNTTYKWVFNGTHTLAPSTSANKTVKVARRLMLAIADRTLSATQKLRASGRETPAKVGSLVNLYRHNASGTRKIGSATVRSDGTWSLSRDFPRGTYSVYATSPADSNYAAGRSPSITVSSA